MCNSGARTKMLSVVEEFWRMESWQKWEGGIEAEAVRQRRKEKAGNVA